MKRKQYAEQQTIAIPKSYQGRATVADLACRHGTSEQSTFRWKARFGGLDVCDAKRLRAAAEKNLRPKRLAADLSLDK
jgi:putative transposase